MIAAEYLGLPHATILDMAAGSFVHAEVVGKVLDELRAHYALPPDPQMEMPNRHLALSPFPPSFRDPAYPLPPTGQSFCPAPDPNEKAPAWLTSLPDQATVYFTLGTVFNLESDNLFTRVLAGLRDLPVNVIVTVGPHLDPAELGPLPLSWPTLVIIKLPERSVMNLGRYRDAITPYDCSSDW